MMEFTPTNQITTEYWLVMRMVKWDEIKMLNPLAGTEHEVQMGDYGVAFCPIYDSYEAALKQVNGHKQKGVSQPSVLWTDIRREVNDE